MFCVSCNSPLKPGAKFCVSCGAAISRGNTDPNYAPQKPKKSATPIIIVLAAVVLLLGGAVTVGMFFLPEFFLFRSSNEPTGPDVNIHSHIYTNGEPEGYAEYEPANDIPEPDADPNEAADNAEYVQDELPPEEDEADQEPYVSGRQAAEELLMGFPSLFRGMPILGLWGLEEGQFHIGWDDDWNSIISYEVPEVYFWMAPDWEDNGYFDRYGNRITHGHGISNGMHALYFTLYDFDNSGIPDIHIHWGRPDANGPVSSLFRFVNGQYRPMYFRNWDGEYVYVISWVFGSFFLDGDGRLVTGLGEGGVAGYDHVLFNDDIITLSRLFTVYAGYPTDEIHCAVSGESFPLYGSWWDELYEMGYWDVYQLGITLTPAPRLPEMQADITDSVRRRLNID